MLMHTMSTQLIPHLVVLLLIFVSVYSQAKDDDTCEVGDGNFKINRGVAALVGEFPYSVALMYDDYTTRCTGSVLTKTHVLTAAHCPVNPLGIEVHELMVGDVVKPDCQDVNLVTLQLRTFSKYFRHPKYFVKKPKNVWFVKNAQYDIAILIVDKPFKFSYAVKPVQLSDSPLPLDSSCVLAGWGRLHWKKPNSTSNLMFRYDTIRDKTNCKSQAYHILCGGPRFGCPGDCGSSLICEDGKAYGVFNNAIKIKRHFYMLYADVYWHRKWILSIINDGHENKLDTRLSMWNRCKMPASQRMLNVLILLSLIIRLSF